MPNLFIIAGCNGAGKTTASYTTLPELLHVREFVNADEIARGLSPFQPETVAIEAGKIMLRRMDELMARKRDFAFESTLSSKSVIGLVRRAKALGYAINLVFYWLNSVELAKARVRSRVSEGGHSIPEETIRRRYYAGIRNFIQLYRWLADNWLLIDNSNEQPQPIAEGGMPERIFILSEEKWNSFNLLAIHGPR